MLLELSLAMAIRATQPSLPQHLVTTYAKTVAEESRKNHIDPWIFFAIVKRESTWRSSVIGYEDEGSCWVGLGQIRVPGCSAEEVQKLRNPIYNLHRSAVLQHDAMRWSAKHRTGRHWLFLYNCSAKYVSFVLKTAREARHAYAST